ncbi:MAG: hypothetical protein FWD31_15795, partial [Planctomycetaceae bacterium]|nr:hypothetical protein [Planctomycetaceae bacterium]
MKFFRREFLFFILGVTSLGLFGYVVRRSMKKPLANDAPDDVFVLPESATHAPVCRLDALEFRVDRLRRTVCAYHVETEELVWESQG